MSGQAKRVHHLRPFGPLPMGGSEEVVPYPGFDLVHYSVTPEEVLATARALKARREAAHRRPLREVLEALDRVGGLWGKESSPWRKEAVEVLPPRVVVDATIEANGKVTASCRGTFVRVFEGHPAFVDWG